MPARGQLGVFADFSYFCLFGTKRKFTYATQAFGSTFKVFFEGLSKALLRVHLKSGWTEVLSGIFWLEGLGFSLKGI